MINFTALSLTVDFSPWGKEAWGTNPAFSSERLELAGQVTLIGMLMVFAVLAILWAVLAIFKTVFAKPVKKEAKPEPKTEKKVETAPATPIVPVAAVTDDAELVAVITAAIAAYRAAEEPDAIPNGFRVVSYRRTNGGRAWNTK